MPQALQRVLGVELRQLIELCIAHDAHQRPEARQLLKHPFFESLRNVSLATACVPRSMRRLLLGCRTCSRRLLAAGPLFFESLQNCEFRHGVRALLSTAPLVGLAARTPANCSSTVAHVLQKDLREVKAPRTPKGL